MVAFLAALPAIASLGGTIASSIIGSNAAKETAKAQAAALARAEAFQRENRQFALNQFNPTISATSGAIPSLSALSGLADPQARQDAINAFQTSPGFQFALDTGNRAVERSALGRGAFNSGRTLADLARFGQGLANQEFAAHVNRLQQLASLNQGARGAVVNAATNAGNALGNLAIQGGSARAGGITGGANALIGGLGSLGDIARRFADDERKLAGGAQSAFPNSNANDPLGIR